MGWKGNVRAFGATMRRIERESIRRQKELARQRAHYSKMQQLEQAAYEVDVYNNTIDQLTTLHKESASQINWAELANSNPPTEPIRQSKHEDIARKKLSGYRPSIIDRIFKLQQSRIDELNAELELAIIEDNQSYHKAASDYKTKLADYEETKSQAERIINGDITAYKETIEELKPYDEISGLGSNIEILFNSKSTITISLRIHDDHVIPRQTKTLLSSGKLSVKETPIGKYNEIYQDYVCSASLRIAREFFAALPISNVVVNAIGNCLDDATGRMAERTILSVLFVRETIDQLNFELIDPSSSMRNFKHNMNFKKTNGFTPVDKISHINI